MRVGLLLTTTILLGCAGTAGGAGNEAAGRPEPRGNDEVMRDDTPAQRGTLLRVSLDANPEIHVGEEEDLALHVRVTNEGDEPIAADSVPAQLRVDDLRAIQLDLTGHGWVTLAPGESVEWDARNLGVRLFDEPGEHTLRLEIGDSLSDPVRVRVSE